MTSIAQIDAAYAGTTTENYCDLCVRWYEDRGLPVPSGVRYQPVLMRYVEGLEGKKK